MENKTQICNQRIFNKRISESETVSVTMSEVHLQGNQYPYFSITHKIFGPTGLESCGAISEDDLLKHFPELVKWHPMHGSDSLGTPMHDLENGFYYLSHPEEFTDEVVSRHFRMDEALVPELRLKTKEDVSSFVEAQRPRWLQEAREFRAFLQEK